jgi:hypothetical protein
MGEFGKDVTSIAMMLGGIALFALVIGHSKDAATIIDSATRGYGGLLGIVTLQNNYSNFAS